VDAELPWSPIAVAAILEDRWLAAFHDGVLSQISIATDSCSVPLVEGEHATESFASADAADGRGRIAGGEGDDVVQALVVALGVVVLHELAQHGAHMTFAKGNDVPEALVLDRANKPLGVGVQVRAPRRQAQQLYARGLEQGPKCAV
jgi:hypothetical protein